MKIYLKGVKYLGIKEEMKKLLVLSPDKRGGDIASICIVRYAAIPIEFKARLG